MKLSNYAFRCMTLAFIVALCNFTEFLLNLAKEHYWTAMVSGIMTLMFVWYTWTEWQDHKHYQRLEHETFGPSEETDEN